MRSLVGFLGGSALFFAINVVGAVAFFVCFKVSELLRPDWMDEWYTALPAGLIAVGITVAFSVWIIRRPNV